MAVLSQVEYNSPCPHWTWWKQMEKQVPFFCSHTSVVFIIINLKRRLILGMFMVPS